MEKEKEKFELDISSEKKRFKDHLELVDNNQIIFSGIFGIGKTYFLDSFFKQELESYETIKISPVNYSISSSDDIIDYIKYDIIFQLLSKNIDFEKTNFSEGLTSQMYIRENFKDVMKILANNASKISKPFSTIFKSLKEIKEKIEKHNTDVNIKEEKELIDFLEEIKDKSGGIYEENNITVLISKLIYGIKNSGKEVVLIIDDTDRLDPEHVFRIFNVFACHFEFDQVLENKFSIDRIILVCDIDNIRKMFHSKYGQNVDFSGYIDKFYSKEIYSFNNKEVVTNSINDLLKSVKKNDGNGLFAVDKNWITILRVILYDMIMTNSINLRNLLKMHNSIFDFISYSFRNNDSYIAYNSNQYNLFFVFDFLKFLLGSQIGLELSLSKLCENTSEIYLDKYSRNKYGDIIVFLELDKHERGKEEYVFSNKDMDLKIIYKLEMSGYKFYALIDKIKNFKDEDINTFPMYRLLNLAFDKYKKL